MYTFKKSINNWKKSKKYLTGGESSQGRTWLFPLCIDYGKGSKVYDIDGNQYIDYMLAYGPLILGHCHPKVVEAVKRQSKKSLVNGFTHAGEFELAKKIVKLIPGIEQVKFNVSGTEAVQAAIRTARVYTGKNKILKFIGQYHGWVDGILVSGAATKKKDMGGYNNPKWVTISKGQPQSVLRDIVACQWNDLNLVEKIIKKNKNEIAAIITEPMMTNSHIIPPEAGYLEGLKKIAKENDILLIFDEVVTGFRVNLRGGQEYFKVMPDITVFAKAMGGGVPISCFGASKEIMSVIHSEGNIHLGTFNSNPLAVAAANAVVDELISKENIYYPKMKKLGIKLKKGIIDIFSEKGYPIRVQGTESLFAVMFIDKPVKNFADTFDINVDILKDYKIQLFKHGIMVRPELRDIWYLSTEHTEEDIDKTLNIISDIARNL